MPRLTSPPESDTNRAPSARHPLNHPLPPLPGEAPRHYRWFRPIDGGAGGVYQPFSRKLFPPISPTLRRFLPSRTRERAGSTSSVSSAEQKQGRGRTGRRAEDQSTSTSSVQSGPEDESSRIRKPLPTMLDRPKPLQTWRRYPQYPNLEELFPGEVSPTFDTRRC